MLERKEVILLNGEVIELDLVDGRYYGVMLENGDSYVYKYRKSQIGDDSVTSASHIVDLNNNILCAIEHEYEELKVADNSRVDYIVEVPKFIGDYITKKEFWSTNGKATVKVVDDKIDFGHVNIPNNFVEAIYNKQKGLD